MSIETVEHGLLFPFYAESESFTNGFEMGQLYEEMKRGESIMNRLIHTANTRQVYTMGHAMNYHGWFEDSGTEGWSYAFLKPRSKGD